MVLLWDDPANLALNLPEWENAVLGDSGTNTTNSNYLDFQGSFALFESDYDVADSNLNDFLGAYGVDTTTDTVWAVINHNSTFSTGNLAIQPEQISTPEPSTWMSLLGGLGLLFALRRRLAR